MRALLDDIAEAQLWFDRGLILVLRHNHEGRYAGFSFGGFDRLASPIGASPHAAVPNYIQAMEGLRIRRPEALASARLLARQRAMELPLSASPVERAF